MKYLLHHMATYLEQLRKKPDPSPKQIYIMVSIEAILIAERNDKLYKLWDCFKPFLQEMQEYEKVNGRGTKGIQFSTERSSENSKYLEKKSSTLD